jgi:hypothetical protein
MALCHLCNRQVLLEKRIAIGKLLSLDELCEDLPPQKLDQLRDTLLGSADPKVAELVIAMSAADFAICVALSVCWLSSWDYVQGAAPTRSQACDEAMWDQRTTAIEGHRKPLPLAEAKT